MPIELRLHLDPTRIQFVLCALVSLMNKSVTVSRVFQCSNKSRSITVSHVFQCWLDLIFLLSFVLSILWKKKLQTQTTMHLKGTSVDCPFVIPWNKKYKPAVGSSYWTAHLRLSGTRILSRTGGRNTEPRRRERNYHSTNIPIHGLVSPAGGSENNKSGSHSSWADEIWFSPDSSRRRKIQQGVGQEVSGLHLTKKQSWTRVGSFISVDQHPWSCPLIFWQLNNQNTYWKRM